MGIQGIKRSGILRWFQKYAEVLRLAKREKKFYRKTEFLGTWKILQKIVFLRKNLWELLDARVLHIFEISAIFRFFWYPLHPISKKFFFNSYKGGAIFLEVKRSIKIETVPYFKNAFLKTSLRISRPNQNHMKQSDLGKSLDPNIHIYSSIGSSHCKKGLQDISRGTWG